MSLSISKVHRSARVTTVLRCVLEEWDFEERSFEEQC